MRTNLQSLKYAVEEALGPHWWFFWLGLVCYVLMAFLALNSETSVSQQNLASNIFLLIVFIPSGVTYFVMAHKAVKEFGKKLLPALIVVLWPKAFLVLVSVFPFAYLIWKSFAHARPTASSSH